MPTIGLCMIVKNEAKLIRRCLDSVRPLIDFAAIDDTGSTDGTQDIIRRWLLEHKIEGHVWRADWKDFASNRNSALANLKNYPEIDYAFMIDADDQLAISIRG